MPAGVRAVLALLLAPSVLAGQPPVAPSAPPPAFPTAAELVTVDVVVVHPDGRPVSDLEAGDFTVLEDGRPRPVESFERVELPPPPEPPAPATRPRASSNLAPLPARTFAIVFDEAHLGTFTADRARAAVETFLREETRPGDRVILASTGGGAWWTDTLPEGRDDLVAVLARFDGRAPRTTASDYVTDWEAMRIHAQRDERVAAAVQRRFVENGAIPDYMPGVAGGGAPDFVGQGQPLV